MNPWRRADSEQVLRTVEACARRIGVVRVGSTTALDDLGLPTATAIRDQVMEPGITVHSGKGSTEELARIGALAEAIERWSAEPRGRIPVLRGKEGVEKVSPGALGLAPWSRYVPGTEIDWVGGRTLTGPALLPANAVFFPYEPPMMEHLFASHTTGLAVGSSVDEAVLFGLLECIERDAMARVVGALEAGEQPGSTVVEPSEQVDAGELFLHDITGPTRVPTVLAVLARDGVAHLGCAARPTFAASLEAATREAGQSRNTDVQGAREDLSRPREPPHPWFISRRVPARPSAGFGTGELKNDLCQTIAHVEGFTKSPVAWVELLSEPGVVSVRVVAPGLQRFEA